MLFGLSIALLLPVVAVLMPNSNTAAMLPLPHVAGTAAALLGTVSTAGGSLLGSVIDARFDGTVAPFAQGVLLYALIAFAGIFLLGLRNVHRRRGRRPGCSRSPPRTDAGDPRGHGTTVVGRAGLAQLVEHLTCNHEVAGSIPAPGSRESSWSERLR